MHETQKKILLANENDQAATCVVLAERWLRDHPDDSWMIHEYAEMLYMMTRYDEAIRVYTDAIERFGDRRLGFYCELGHLFRYRGNFPEAERWYRKASEEDPDEASSFIFLGSIQARQGNLRTAESSHRRATSCSKGCIDEAFHNLGLVLRGQGRLSEAADCFRKAIEIDAEYEDAVIALEDVLRAMELIAAES